MDESLNYSFNLPNSSNNDEIADISKVSENFVKLDSILKNIEDRVDETHEIVVDSFFSSTSKNPVQNKVISNGVANSIKLSSSGNPIRFDDLSPLEHEMAVGLRSKNLIDTANIKYGYELGSSYGTILANADWYVTGWIPVKPSTTYTISGTSSLYRAEVDANFKEVSASNFVQTSTFTTTEKTHYIQFNSLIVGYDKPQLEIGTTATAYTPFVDVNGASVQKYGKNLLPIVPFDESKTTNGITFTLNDDNSLHIKGTATANTYFAYVGEGSLVRKPIKKGKYTISGADGLTENDRITIGVTDVSEYYCRTGENKTVEIAEDNTFCFKVQVMAGSVVDATVYPQLEFGTVATDYEKPKEPATYTADENGNVKGVTSIYPTTTLMAGDGVSIEAEYNADTKKYIDKKFAELAELIVNS